MKPILTLHFRVLAWGALLCSSSVDRLEAVANDPPGISEKQVEVTKVSLKNLGDIIPIDIGRVSVGETVAFPFALVNGTSAAIAPKEFRTTCGCAVLTPTEQGAAGPGDELLLQLRFEASKKPEVVERPVTLVGEDGNAICAVVFKANVVAHVALSEWIYHVDDEDDEIRISGAFDSGVKSPEAVKVELLGEHLELYSKKLNGREFTLVVKRKPSFSLAYEAGPIEDNLRFSFELADSRNSVEDLKIQVFDDRVMNVRPGILFFKAVENGGCRARALVRVPPGYKENYFLEIGGHRVAASNVQLISREARMVEFGISEEMVESCSAESEGLLIWETGEASVSAKVGVIFR